MLVAYEFVRSGDDISSSSSSQSRDVRCVKRATSEGISRSDSSRMVRASACAIDSVDTRVSIPFLAISAYVSA